MSTHTPNTPATTFLFLVAHEPSDPPSITDAGSQAGQAFNQVLRYIAGCKGFHSQLFGWPSQPDVEDISMNDYMASILPGTFAIFVNWVDQRWANYFLEHASMRQALQGFTTFFDMPKMGTRATEVVLRDSSMAFNIVWSNADAFKILEQTRAPLKITLSDHLPDPDNDNDQLKESEEGAENRENGRVFFPDGSRGPNFVMENVIDGCSTSVLSSVNNTNQIQLSLMRTRYCSRLKENLNDAIRSRHVD